MVKKNSTLSKIWHFLAVEPLTLKSLPQIIVAVIIWFTILAAVVILILASIPLNFKDIELG